MGITARALPQSNVRGSAVLILVLLGTNPYSFERLARATDEYARTSGKEVFIQLGHTPYTPQCARYERFLTKQDLIKKIYDAELVITQGGFGSIAECLIAGKKVIAVPRKPDFNESPDRQEELVRELERLGRVLGVYEVSELPTAVEKVLTMEFKEGNLTTIPQLINKFLAGGN